MYNIFSENLTAAKVNIVSTKQSATHN